jgi:SAM-dependent methyltransferase
MTHGSGPYERFIAPRKRRLLEGLSGTVLEIGPGTGSNLPYIPRAVRYIAAEPNVYMHDRLRAAAAERAIDLELRAQATESLDLPEGSIDAAVCTLVLCSVENPAAVIDRALHFLRPGGQFVFIEHTAAAAGTWLRAMQRTVRPVWRVLGDGCHPDRETWNVLGGAGFGSLNYERFYAPFPIVSPHIAGIAIRAEDA